MKNQLHFIAFLLLLFFFSYTQAQNYFVGVKGGVNYNTIGDLYHLGDPIHGYGSSPIPNIDLAYSPNNEMGNHYGIYVTADFGKFFVRPEVNFTSMKSSYDLKKTANWSSSKIEIPILIGYNIYKPVSIYAGPVFSSISDRELEGLRVQTPLQTIKFDKNTTGIGVGVLVQYKRFGLDIRYVNDITKVKQQQQIKMIVNTYGTFVADLVEYNPSQISVSLTIDLFHFTFDKTARTKSRYNWRNHKNLR